MVFSADGGQERIGFVSAENHFIEIVGRAF
jgi:hypothetical protein